jgi:hypothetical protein
MLGPLVKGPDGTRHWQQEPQWVSDWRQLHRANARVPNSNGRVGGRVSKGDPVKVQSVPMSLLSSILWTLGFVNSDLYAIKCMLTFNQVMGITLPIPSCNESIFGPRGRPKIPSSDTVRSWAFPVMHLLLLETSVVLAACEESALARQVFKADATN